MITRYALIAALLAAIAAGGWIVLLQIENSSLQAENERLDRSIAALREQVAQSALAREVEAARAERWALRSKELSETIEQLRGIPDAPLDPGIIELLDGLRSGR